MNNTLPFPGARAADRRFYWQTWSKHYNPEAAKAEAKARQIQRRIAKLEREQAALKAKLGIDRMAA